MFYLNDEDWDIVTEILNRLCPKNVEIYVFGSRATGVRLKKFSDIDFCLKGPEKLDRDVIYKLKEAFTHSDLPIRVDIADWHDLSDKFKSIIEKDMVRVDL